MHLPRLLLAALLCFALGPASAQEGGDDGSGIEVSEDPKPGEEKPAAPGDGYDEEETKKKNVGLAGGGEQDDGDANAPEVKRDLQTRINEAIKKGVEALKKLQNDDGSWGPVRANSKYDNPNIKGDFVRDELGPTAWAIYTLAKCGVKRDDKAIKDGLRYIAKQTQFVFDVLGGEAAKQDETKGFQGVSEKSPRPLTVYESAAIVLMIEAVYEGSAKLTGKHTKRKMQTENPEERPAASKIPEDAWKTMHDRILWLTVGRKLVSKKGGGGGRARGGGGSTATTTIKGTQNIGEGGKNQGGWRYGQANGDADLSATQFVLLALRAASQAGYPIEQTAPNVWTLAATYVKNCQKGDGGFGYQTNSGPSYSSMTACGVACLIICREQMLLAASQQKDEAKAPPEWMEESIRRGMEWLDKNFDAETNQGAERAELFYYLYGVERVGDLAGRKEFNGKDWYVRGARLLLERQEADGKWQDATGFRPHDVLGTCFALLFLKRATPPVVTYSEADKGE